MSDNPVKWTAAGLTPAGNALQAALLGTGDGLTFTRAVAADAEGVERLDLTLQSPCTVDGPKCRVPVLLTNAGVDTAFTMTELRFYVRRVTDGAPTGEEILYATVTDETGDPIPTAAQSPGFTIDWAFVFQYGNAGSVTVTLDPVGLVSIGMVGRPGGVAALGDNGAVPVSQGGTGATTAPAALTALGAMRADATGEDIPVSKTDGTTIHAALANKAEKAPPQEYDLPLAEGFFHYDKSTASSYAKADDGLVVVHLYCKRQDGASFGGAVQLATIPAGYRPSHNVHTAAMLSKSGDSRYENQCCVLVCDPGGNIWLSNAPMDTKAVTATIVFYSI